MSTHMTVPMTVRPIELELIIEDGESSSSFCAKWQSPRGYLALARSTPEVDVYCELNGQENGFRSKTVVCEISDRTLTIELASDESFLRSVRLQSVVLELPLKANIASVRHCLAHVFALPA